MSELSWKAGNRLEKHINSLQAIGWQVNLRQYAWSPPTDLYETDASYVVRVEVAGMRDTDFSINLEQNFLTISGVRIDEQERRSYHQMEIRFGEFSTTIELPPGADGDKAEAEYEQGFLTVILPKIKPAGIKVVG